ncbi:hypothetical protein RFI_21665, partial [Reticulomyxa filosa]
MTGTEFVGNKFKRKSFCFYFLFCKGLYFQSVDTIQTSAAIKERRGAALVSEPLFECRICGFGRSRNSLDNWVSRSTIAQMSRIFKISLLQKKKKKKMITSLTNPYLISPNKELVPLHEVETRGDDENDNTNNNDDDDNNNNNNNEGENSLMKENNSDKNRKKIRIEDYFDDVHISLENVIAAGKGWLVLNKPPCLTLTTPSQQCAHSLKDEL